MLSVCRVGDRPSGLCEIAIQAREQIAIGVSFRVLLQQHLCNDIRRLAYAHPSFFVV